MQNVSPSIYGNCLFCGTPLRHTFVDLGMSPLCESYVSPAHLNSMEPFYPLHVFVCESCYLVQLQEYVNPADIFSEYAYFSSYSDSWVDHARRYTEMITTRLGLTAKSLVVELASNDGYLLQHFVKKGIPVLGIEPAANVARAADERNVPTLVEFFDDTMAKRLSAEGKQADLIVGNNVLAQVPGVNAFVEGIKLLLKPGGVVTIEFPHLMRLMQDNQFDTIYHEHFFYFSFIAAEKVFAAHGLTLFDVEELPTHGGSLRIYGRHDKNTSLALTERARELRSRELAAGLMKLETYDVVRPPGPGDKAETPRYADRTQTAGENDRWLRRARQGKYASQLLRDPARFPRLHRRPEPLQAG